MSEAAVETPPRQQRNLPWVGLLILASLVIVFSPLALSNSFDYNRWDNFEYYTPVLWHVHAALLDGQIPRMNFHQHLGEPLPANVQSGWLYPPYTLAVAAVKWLGVPLDSLMLLVVLIHLPLHMLGVFFLLRHLGVRPELAAMAAISGASGGYLLLYTGVWIFMLPVSACIAWTLLGCIYLMDGNRSVLGGILTSSGFAALALIGHSQMTVYVWLWLGLLVFAGSVICYRSFTRWLRVAPFIVAAILLSMPVMLPTYFYLDETLRQDRVDPKEFLVYGAARRHVTLGILTPVLNLPNGFLTEEVSPMLFQGGHIGPLLAMMFVAGSTWRRHRYSQRGTQHAHSLGAWAITTISVSILFLLFAFGVEGWIYKYTYSIPVWSSMRWPNKFLLFTNWGLAVCAGLAAETLCRQGSACRRRRLLVGLGFVVGTAFLVWLLPSPWLSSVSGQTCFWSGLATMAVLPWIHVHQVQQVLVALVLACGAGMSCLAQDIDLKPYAERAGAYGPRVLGIDDSARVLPLSESLDMQQHGLSHSATMNGYVSLTGCSHQFVPKRYLRTVPSSILGVPNPHWTIQVLSSHLLRSLNVGFLIANRNDIGVIEFIERLGGFERSNHLGDVVIYKAQKTLPRAYFASELREANKSAMYEGLVLNKSPMDTAYVARPPRQFANTNHVRQAQWHDNGRVELTVEAPQDGYLVASVVYLPGWSAYVDERPSPVDLVNDAVIGTPVPAGARKVVFQYVPPGERMGLALGGLGLLVLSGLLVVMRWPLPRNKQQRAA